MDASLNEPPTALDARVLPFPSARRAVTARLAWPAPQGWLREAVGDDARVEMPDDLVRTVLQAWRASA